MEPMEGASTVERMLLSRASQQRTPITGSMELLPLCNMNCDMCYVRLNRTEMERKGRLRTGAEWLALGEEMTKSGVLFLLLTGGEPLLYPDFREVYLGLKRMGMILTVNTNGTLLDEEWADFLAASKPRRINITLYGADDAAYQRLCHYPGGFEKTINAIRLLRQRDVDVRMNVSVTRENVHDLEKLLTIARELDVPVVMDTYMQPVERDITLPFKLQSRLTPEDAARAEIRRIRFQLTPEEFHQFALARIELYQQFEPDKSATHMTCLAGSCSFAVNWQGELRPCLVMDEPVASVFEVGFDEAWKQVCSGCRDIHISDFCALCHLRPLCRTCAASAKIETGRFDGVPEYLCRCTAEYLRLLQEEAERLSHG